MKRISLIMAVVMLCTALCSCSATKQCEPEEMIASVASAQELVATVYSDSEEMFKLDGGDRISELLKGKWVKTSASVADAKKLLSITVSMQYEVCFFEGGKAMIYYGFCGVMQKDRQYYDVTLDSEGGTDALLDYISENGTATAMENEK